MQWNSVTKWRTYTTTRNCNFQWHKPIHSYSFIKTTNEAWLDQHMHMCAFTTCMNTYVLLHLNFPIILQTTLKILAQKNIFHSPGNSIHSVLFQQLQFPVFHKNNGISSIRTNILRHKICKKKQPQLLKYSIKNKTWLALHYFYYYSYIKVFTITFQLQPIKTIPSKYNGRGTEVLNGIIADNTKHAEVALWRKLASTNLQVGDTMRLSQVTKLTATFTPEVNVKFSSGRYTTIE